MAKKRSAARKKRASKAPKRTASSAQTLASLVDATLEQSRTMKGNPSIKGVSALINATLDEFLALQTNKAALQKLTTSQTTFLHNTVTTLQDFQTELSKPNFDCPQVPMDWDGN